jgi:hypothetical protein
MASGEPTPFAMVVQQTLGFGGVQVAGILTHGELPAEGSRVTILQAGRRPLTATVSGAARLPEPARVHLGLGGVNAKDVRPGARVATDPKLLEEPLPPELRPKSPENPTTAAEAYSDYRGSALDYAWLRSSGVDFDNAVHLADAAAGDLARRLAGWSATRGSRVEALRLGTDPV